MLRQFCSPIFDLDNMTKAYKSEFNFAPFGGQRDQIGFFSKENGISFIKRLKSNELKIQPWRTPLSYGKGPV